MYFYTNHRDEAGMERWAARLVNVPEDWWQAEPLVARALALAAGNATSCYASRSHPRHVFWRALLARLAQAFPQDLFIQEKAKFPGVSARDQARGSAVSLGSHAIRLPTRP